MVILALLLKKPAFGIIDEIHDEQSRISFVSALDIVLTVEPCRNTIDELIVEKFLRTSNVFLDKVTLLMM